MKKILAYATLLSLTACGGGGSSGSTQPSSQPAVTPSSSATSSRTSSSSEAPSSASSSNASAISLNTNIVGLWDATEDYGVDGKDEAYVLIENNGSLTVYDYAGDTFDNEGNCYWITKSPNIISSLGGNRYLISPVGEKPFVEIYTVSGNKLTAVDEVITEDSVTGTAIKSNRAISDFTPECSNKLSQGSTLNSQVKPKLAKPQKVN